MIGKVTNIEEGTTRKNTYMCKINIEDGVSSALYFCFDESVGCNAIASGNTVEFEYKEQSGFKHITKITQAAPDKAAKVDKLLTETAEQRDMRIVRQSCLQAATRIASENSTITDVIDIAEKFVAYIYDGVSLPQDEPTPQPTKQTTKRKPAPVSKPDDDGDIPF